MSAHLTHCRDPLWLGGSGFELPPPLNTAARAWSAADTGGLPADTLEGCTVTDEGTIICGTVGAPNVYVSRDGGASFALQALGVAFNYPQRPQFGGGVVLLGGLSDNFVYGSTDDAKTWRIISSTLASGNGAHTFVYGNGVWVAAAGGAYGDTQIALQYSTNNGATWSAALSTGTGADFVDVSLCWDGEQFLMCGSTAAAAAYVATSPDGRTWTAHELTNGLVPECMAASPGLYFIGDVYNSYVISSSLGGLLTQAPALLPDAGATVMDIVKSVIFQNGTVLVLASQGNSMFTLDRGATWTQDAPPWKYEPGGANALAAGPVALVNEKNLVCALSNVQKLIGVRGVNC